jgi:hypothetical protein
MAQVSRAKASTPSRAALDLAYLVRLGHSDVVGFAADFHCAFLLECHGEAAFASRLSAQVFLVRSALASADPWRKVMMGRDPANDVVLRHRSISRRHASFERDRDTGVYLLFDHGSRNGTKIDGRRAAPGRTYAVASGARLRLGDLSFIFLCSEDMFSIVARLQATNRGWR